MAKTMTARAIEQIKPAATRREIPDGLLTGLYLVVQPTGARSWALRYRYAGKPAKLTLGPYPAIGLAEARDEAKTKLQIVAKGGDPASEKRQERQEAIEGRNLVANVVAEFLDRHAKSLRSKVEIKRMFDHDVLPSWGKRQIQDISRRDVIALMDVLIDRGVGTMTNRIFSVVRKLFNWCASRDIITASPCVGMRPPVPEISRDRVLTDEEIRRFWKATGALGYPFGPLFQLLLATGQRLNEVAGAPWSELNLDKRLWSLPKERTKNARPHDVPLSELALEIITGLPRLAGTRSLVFTTTGVAPASGFSRAKRNLDKAMAADGEDIPPFTLHDLRRTAATGFQKIGIPPHVTEAVLNHKSGTLKGVAGVYARFDYAKERRDALEAWGRYVTTLIAGHPADNVVAIGQARSK